MKKFYILFFLPLLYFTFFFNVNSYANSEKDMLNPSYIKLNGKKVVDWNKPTSKNYVDLANVPAENLKIVVDQKHQNVNIYQNNKLIEKFICSTGKKDPTTVTPIGTFAIQPEHGTWFYNPEPNVTEGARNFVSFKDHGVYLFHSVVTDQNNKILMSRQGRLGHPNSHGCIQMSFQITFTSTILFHNQTKSEQKLLLNPLTNKTFYNRLSHSITVNTYLSHI